MNLKVLAFLLAVLTIGTFGFAESISNYNVPATIPLNETLTIAGIYNNTSIGGVLCAFFLKDAGGDQNQVIVRLSDEPVFTDGSFYSQLKITEPLFRRGKDYNAITKCGTTEIGKIFYVQQKEDIAFGISSESMRNDFAFFLNPDNSLTIFILGLVGLFVLTLIAVIFQKTGLL